MKKRAIVRVGGLLAAAGLLLAIGSAGALDNDAIPAGQAFAQAAAGMAMYGVGLAIAKIAGAKKEKRRRSGTRHLFILPGLSLISIHASARDATENEQRSNSTPLLYTKQKGLSR